MPDRKNDQGPARNRTCREVLIIEDSEDVRELLFELLEADGHRVTLAKSGPEGVEAIARMHPEVALIDVGLPGLDGYEVARRVRASPGGDDVYLVALTGYGGAEARVKAESAGFDLHLVKPVDVDALSRIVAVSRRGGPGAKV